MGARTPIWKRALFRWAIAAAILFAAFEGLIVLGKTTRIDDAEALFISVTAGGVYAALWSLFAMATARMLEKIDRAAREEKP